MVPSVASSFALIPIMWPAVIGVTLAFRLITPAGRSQLCVAVGNIFHLPALSQWQLSMAWGQCPDLKGRPTNTQYRISGHSMPVARLLGYWRRGRGKSPIQYTTDIEGLAQDCHISLANTLEIPLSSTKPSIYRTQTWQPRSLIRRRTERTSG